MPVRGKKPIWPKSGGTPTGMFKQPQKNDPVDFAHKDLVAYAHGTKTRGIARGGSGGQSLRHQAPNKGPKG